MKSIFVLVCFIQAFAYLHAQEFGGNPPSTHWQQVNTDTFRVVFPKGLDSVAQRIANMANTLNTRTLYTIGNRQKKINILLQNATTISNGYVALGPFRSEFELLPQQNSFDLGSLPWPDNLVIHEWRHVQQYSNFNHGLSKAFFILFGQEGQALANGLAVPDWFFEGDAVFQETLVSQQGRGRMPSFFNGYRSLWQAGRNYSWMKLRNGSLRDYTPDHYRLGYMMVAYGREKYGPAFWKNVTHDAASFKGLLYPMQKAVKKATGQSYTAFRNETLTYFKDKLTDSTGVSNASRHFIADEEYPYWIVEGKVVYMRSSYDRIPQFTIRENGKDTKIRARDISIDNYFSYRNGKIVYAAYQPDIRWGRVDYSDIKLLDIKAHKEISVTHRTKYFAPELSADGNTLVAVHVDELGRSALHIMDIQGKLKREIPNPDHLFYTYPKFYDNKILSAVRNRVGQMSLALVDMATGMNSYLLPFTYNVIAFPSVENNVIYFSASNGNFDRLYQIKDGELKQVSQNNSSSGDYQLHVLNGKMVWTHFTDQGYQLRFSDLNAANKKPNAIQPSATHLGLVSLENADTSLLTLRNDTSYPVKKYSQSFHLLNFHSRQPYIDDPDYTFSFISENILNTLQAEAFVTYNRNEGYTRFGMSAIYSQLFPWLNLSSDYTIDRNTLLSNRPNRVYWDEWETTAGFSVPLNLTKGRTFTSLTFGSDLVYNKRYFKGYYKDTFDNRGFAYLNNSVVFTNQIQQARKQIYPRLAQTLTLNYKSSVSNLVAQQFLASGSLYLPGAFITHSLVLQAAFQGRDSNLNVIYSNSFPFSRGYAVASFYRMAKVGVNYHFPLVYPDWGFGSIVYFLRVRANLFYDFTRVKDFTDTPPLLASRDFRSFGTEIFFDTRWWNQLPVTIGIRYSHLLDPDIEGRSPNQWEIVLPTNLLSRY